MNKDKNTYNRIMPKFNSEICGTISYGPTNTITCSVVTYRNHKNQFKFYGDLRLNSYSVKKHCYYATPKGITLPHNVMKELIPVLSLLPTEHEEIEKDTQKMYCKIQKYPNLWICASLAFYENDYKIDIREYIVDAQKGYEGFTTKGIRIDYSLKDQLVNMMMVASNKMCDLDIEHTPPLSN